MSVEHFQALAKGVRLNQYEMLGILGAGGFGITYMARDTTLDTLVAIKEYLPGDFAVRQENSQVNAKSSTSKGDFDWGLKRFLDEARVLAKFRHPHIVRVNQIFEANNTAYLVMEYAKGESLDDLLRRAGSLSEQETRDILIPILDGLKRVHELGFLHRDIKPGNIIIREEGGAVLIDFGAARKAIDNKSLAITSIVTEGYAPLEQYDPNGNQGAWTDIYALAGVAYKCLTGNKPPAATSRVRNDPLVPLAVAAPGRVSSDFAAAIEAGLNIYENQRPQNIAEFIALMSGTAPFRAAPPTDDATRVLSPSAPPSMPPARPAMPPQASPPATLPTQMRRMAPLYWGAAAAVLLVVAAGGWFAWRNTNAPQTSVVSAVDSVAAIPAEASPPALPPPAQQAATNETNSPAAPAPVAAAPQPAAPPIEQRPAVPNRQVTEAPLPPQAPPSPAFKPSFDCATAKTDAERLVCGDSQLSTLDVEMATLFQKGLGAVADANAFNGEQLDWLTRRDVCSNKQCLLVSYNERIKELERWVAR